ncbi:nitrite reductase, copper-containing [Haloferax sp. MBLA0076]|uniref:Copper-containing nitrite reductase n=1 Tax=Haloferax litoreum TaxID=2666140 RepID=A0A6A8GKG7_9EURY|nr:MULTISPECIES: copper-containing nitrite reductase [Haloferax]KAB1190379.1 nitrite reductase, copper-containing [Haloferax sp. CBA1148]MRX23349.1 nitrite reductase, copper-containing [Haloferax litoreum]
MLSTTRRRTLQALGLGGVASLAGCANQAPTAAQSLETTTEPAQQQSPNVVDMVAADPTDIPDPIDRNEPAEVDVTLRPEEVTAEVEDGVTFTYMTYNGQVPGPFIRVRQGDTVNLTFENPEENSMPHNVDFHAVAGPGGGAEATMTNPGETANLRFKATYPGAYIYHCAVPNLDMHISAGMFGLILVEPPEGLPDVDHEVYIGQHELYTDKKAGTEGHHGFDFDAMRNEEPTYVLMNGEKFAWTDAGRGPAVTAKTGETVRIFFVDGGPNLSSSFHPIGSVWETLYPDGSLTTEPQTHIQTRLVPPGSTAIATMSSPVPGDFKLVDHSLSRVARKGCMAVVRAEGSEDPEIFDSDPK